jgi:hypothetical protein
MDSRNRDRDRDRDGDMLEREMNRLRLDDEDVVDGRRYEQPHPQQRGIGGGQYHVNGANATTRVWADRDADRDREVRAERLRRDEERLLREERLRREEEDRERERERERERRVRDDFMRRRDSGVEVGPPFGDGNPFRPQPRPGTTGTGMYARAGDFVGSL